MSTSPIANGERGWRAISRAQHGGGRLQQGTAARKVCRRARTRPRRDVRRDRHLGEHQAAQPGRQARRSGPGRAPRRYRTTRQRRRAAAARDDGRRASSLMAIGTAPRGDDQRGGATPAAFGACRQVAGHVHVTTDHQTLTCPRARALARPCEGCRWALADAHQDRVAVEPFQLELCGVPYRRAPSSRRSRLERHLGSRRSSPCRSQRRHGAADRVGRTGRHQAQASPEAMCGAAWRNRWKSAIAGRNALRCWGTPTPPRRRAHATDRAAIVDPAHPRRDACLQPRPSTPPRSRSLGTRRREDDLARLGALVAPVGMSRVTVTGKDASTSSSSSLVGRPAVGSVVNSPQRIGVTRVVPNLGAVAT